MRMLNLRDVLELVNHGLDDRAFASEQLIVQLHLSGSSCCAEVCQRTQPLREAQINRVLCLHRNNQNAPLSVLLH